MGLFMASLLMTSEGSTKSAEKPKDIVCSIKKSYFKICSMHIFVLVMKELSFSSLATVNLLAATSAVTVHSWES